MAASRTSRPSSDWKIVPFVGAIFASAFLIFLVQPLIGKRILPWFGGSPGVWMICLAFYQSALFAGYAYAHALVRMASPARQVLVHGALLGLAFWALPVLPDESWQPADGIDFPRFHILAMLLWNVALPFAILAASSPLLQAWFSRHQPERSPYPLYAVSNLGSFLALLAYPFWIEPRLPVSRTGDLWSIGFIAAGILIAFCGLLAWQKGTPPKNVKAPHRPLRPRTVVLWALLSGTAVAVLMGTTNKLTLDIASIPFLWVLPLSLYLATYILAFSSERFYRRVPFFLFVVILTGASQLWWIFDQLHHHVVLYCGLLFGCCMILHGELYRRRPAPESLTTFYLSISAGGAVAGLLVGLVAPQVFNDYYELPLGVGATGLLFLAVCRGDAKSWIGRAKPRWRFTTAIAALFVVFVAAGILIQFRASKNRVYQERTFFGVLTIRELTPPPQRQLVHGNTMHGVQSTDPRYKNAPTSYYGERTPIGVLLRNRKAGKSTRIGIIGMGIGTLSSYGRPEDSFRFYEIDPAVVRIARNPRYFDVIANSRASIEVVEADGRLAIEAELENLAPPEFDVLILDAFSSDAVPLHLLTREALETYRQALSPDGVMAFHVSNRYLRLTLPIARAAASAGMGSLFAQNPDLPHDMSAFSRWLFTSPSPDRLRSLARQLRREGLHPVPEGKPPMRVIGIGARQLNAVPLWTDDFTDLRNTVALPAGLSRWIGFLQGSALPKTVDEPDGSQAP